MPLIKPADFDHFPTVQAPLLTKNHSFAAYPLWVIDPIAHKIGKCNYVRRHQAQNK
jgi:hypothetical protein